ncbi:YidC/Oxa1 family membrane protein insertase [Helicobacter didelphidarum]|uniref:YidC/Oxa1 family membrane protein insertase n=1 Tax=Helicobacter didelphidarum TaxID=2040648 RepID=UPI0015F1A245|nr:YidC/Oxa1 family membrane protein insertase [Helicobacter didelphidarum]
MIDILYYICIFPLENVLDWLFGRFRLWTHNSSGMGIILSSLTVNLILLKLFLYTDKKAQQESDLKAKLDSRIKGWKKVYKGAKLHAFTNALYRQHKYHPIYALRSLGGLALQIPFFWAMYLVIKKSEVLAGNSFLWIGDLSQPDLVYGVHVLPLLMTLFTLINVFCLSKELGARIQGSLIALLFLVLLYNMPSALVLYWCVNMLFSLLKTLSVKLIERRKEICDTYNKNKDSLDLDSKDLDNITKYFNNLLSQYNQDFTKIGFLQKSKLWFKGLFESYPKFLIKLDSQQIGLVVNNFLVQQASSVVSIKEHNCNKDSIKAYLQMQIQAKQSQFLSFQNLIKWIILSACFIICIFSPYGVYSSDVSQFNLAYTYNTLEVMFGCFLLLSLSLLYFISFFSYTRVFKIVVGLFFAFLLLGVSYTFVLTGDYGLMTDFVFANMPSVSTRDSIIDIVLCVVFVVFAFALLAWRYSIYLVKIIFIVAFVMSLVFAGNIISYVQSHQFLIAEDSKDTKVKTRERNFITKNTQEVDPLFDFSKEKNNVLVIILDRADGYSINQHIENYKDIANKYDGFTYFDRVLSTSGNTAQTLASIIAGEYYTGHNINQRYTKYGSWKEIAQGYAGIFNAFHSAGYKTAGIVEWPLDGAYFYPLVKEKNDVIFNTEKYETFYRQQHGISEDFHKRIPFSKLFSFGVFRFATYSMRPKVYKSGFWLFRVKSVKLSPIAEVYAFKELISNRTTQSTFKFFHFDITHDPYLLDSKCEYTENFGEHKTSEICALKWIAEAIDKMKKLGIYDNTEIFITADHGAHGISDSVLPIKQNFVVPFFYKPYNARGELQINHANLVNYDLATIFCANIAKSETPCPHVAQNILENLPKDRIILTYDMGWKFNKNYFIPYTYYEFTPNQSGDIYDPKNWKDVTEKYKDK